MKKTVITFICIAASMLLLQNCKGRDEDCNDPSNPKCSNYNPCFGKKETSAAFYMYESPNTLFTFPAWLDIKWTLLDSDTSVLGGLIFRAMQENAVEYQWWVGTEVNPRFGREIQIDFGSSKIPKRIRLIVKSNPDNNCFPNDDGIDTVDRMLYFLEDPCNNYPLKGKWEGAFKDNPDSTFIFEYGHCRQSGSQSFKPFFSGFDDTLWYFCNSDLSTYRQKWITGKSTWIDSTTGKRIPPSRINRAFCTLSNNSDSVRILVEYNSSLEAPYRRNFIGIRKK